MRARVFCVCRTANKGKRRLHRGLLARVVLDLAVLLEAERRAVVVLVEDLLAVRDGADDRRLAVEAVDLLERQRARLGDEEVREEEAARARRAPDEEHLHAEVRRLLAVDAVRGRVDEVGRRVPDAEVPQPVGGDGEGHAAPADGEGEDFRGDDPGDGAP